MPDGPDGLLALEDGTVAGGTLFGAPLTPAVAPTSERPEPSTLATPGAGEVVFNTSLTGYPEILTDPSYAGQIVTMTAPLIGNYGIAEEDLESARPWLSGFVCREVSPAPSNFRATEALPDFLRRHGIPALTGVDTRFVTRRVREHGALRGVIVPANVSTEAAVARARALPPMSGQNLAALVSAREPYRWTAGLRAAPFAPAGAPRPERTFRLAVIDTGVKRHILRGLVEAGFVPTVLPADATPADVRATDPEAVFWSNGPGDPAAVTATIATARALAGTLPAFGICLGHQILALALGGRTVKMKFGHHGGNQPVRELATGRIEITAQNHGFAVDAESLPADCEVTHVNPNDGSVEGFRHLREPLFAVQYHPEAAPGPHDAAHLFAQFYRLVATAQPSFSR